MSAHIKTVVSLSLGLLVVFVWHFSTVLGLLGTPPQTQIEFFIRIGVIFGAFLVVSAITAGMVAQHDEQALEPDEREEKAELRAERNGGIFVYFGMIVLMWFVFTPLTPMQTANALLAIMCLAEFVKIASGLIYLQRG